MTVLIVDDEEPLLKNLRGYLGSFDERYRVLTATTAEEGLAMVDGGEAPDVLVTDVRLPGMDGIDLVRRVRTLKPELPIVVMSAFGTETLKREAKSEGALTFLEKPVDLDRFRSVLEEAAGTEAGWSGRIGGLDIFDITQLLAMSGRRLGVRITFKQLSGTLGFEGGQLIHAATGTFRGEAAFFEMVRWEGGTFEELPEDDVEPFQPNVTLPLSQLMIEAARRRDEAERTASNNSAAAGGSSAGGTDQSATQQGAPAPGQHDTKEEWHMAIKDHLQELTGVEGFKAAAVFTAQGEMLEAETVGKYDIKSVGMFANNALLNAQKATDQMGVGRGNLMQIRAPQANIMMRCLNEATDFAATKEGKAHFHTVVVMDPEGNMGMASMILDKVVGRIADELR